MLFSAFVIGLIFAFVIYLYLQSNWDDGGGGSDESGNSPVSPNRPDGPPFSSPPKTDRVVKDEEFIDYLKRFKPQNRFIDIEKETEKEV
jgi:hypothetical protein